jgi:hypothetical protein
MAKQAGMSAIASMLAQSGRGLGQQIGAPVQAFGQNLGQQLGGMLTQRRQAKEIEEARNIVSQYTTAGAINPGMLSKKAQEAELEGKDYLADVFRQGAEQANTNLAAGQNLTAYNQLAAQAGLTPEEASIGVRGLIAGQYKDPSSALKGTMDTQRMVKQKATREYAVEQLRAEGLEEVANDIEKGIYTDAQIGQVLSTSRQANAAAEQGQAALEAFVTTADLSDTTFGQAVAEGKLRDVPSSLVSKLATEAINERQTTELVKNLKSMNTEVSNEAAELLEMGVITDEGAKKLVTEGKRGPKVSTANMKQYYVEGVGLVWGGDITVDGDERKAYRDPQNPNSIVDLPADSVEFKGESRIRGEDLRLAAIQLAEDSKFVDLNATDQEKAKVAFASKYNELITKKKTNEEALAGAKSHALSLIEQRTEKGVIPFFDTKTTEFKEDSVKEFDSIEDAEAANLKPGTIVIINGRRAVIE